MRSSATQCRTLINNGVPLLNSLKLIERGTPNRFIKRHLETVVADVGEGASLARSMENTGSFPEALVDRVAIGEQTGELGKSFQKAAKKYDDDLDIRISRLTTVVPTVMLVFGRHDCRSGCLLYDHDDLWIDGRNSRPITIFSQII